MSEWLILEWGHSHRNCNSMLVIGEGLHPYWDIIAVSTNRLVVDIIRRVENMVGGKFSEQ